MNEEQVERLLNQLADTQESFDNATEVFSSAIKSIKWNRINTMIQYGMLVLVFIFGVLSTITFMNYRQDSCERGNDLRVIVAGGMEQNAFAIGGALAIVFNAPQERLDQFLEAYQDQNATREILQLRDC